MAEDVEQPIEALNQRTAQPYEACRYEEAVKTATQACELAQRHWGEQHLDTAANRNNLAALYGAIGHAADAKPLRLGKRKP